MPPAGFEKEIPASEAAEINGMSYTIQNNTEYSYVSFRGQCIQSVQNVLLLF
jgi:hypothetical protein